MKKYYSMIIILITIMIVIAGCNTGNERQPASLSNFYFDTVVTITIYECTDNNPNDIINQCFDICQKYDDLFSRTKSDSDISHINQNGNKPVSVNKDTYELIKSSMNYSNMTDGAFDITIAPLCSLWDIGNNTDIPNESLIRKNLKLVNYRNITLTNNKVIVKYGSKLDLGGIAKGYVADKLKKYMIDAGVKSAIIDLGGNIVTVGKKSDHDDFTIGIIKPFGQDANDYAATINISNKSIVTSGIYQRYFRKNNKIYHHIIDTKTGYPVDNDLYSVSIISDQSIDGDALSTSALALGIDKGLELINSLDNIYAPSL